MQFSISFGFLLFVLVYVCIEMKVVLLSPSDIQGDIRFASASDYALIIPEGQSFISTNLVGYPVIIWMCTLSINKVKWVSSTLV